VEKKEKLFEIYIVRSDDYDAGDWTLVLRKTRPKVNSRFPRRTKMIVVYVREIKKKELRSRLGHTMCSEDKDSLSLILHNPKAKVADFWKEWLEKSIASD